MYRVGYLEGSSIEGRVLSDRATFVATDSSASVSSSLSARVFFGCQLRETGKFREQEADGILGLQADDQRGSIRSSRMPSVLHALVEQHAASNAFSLCLSSRAGLLLFGGTARQDALLRRGATIARMRRGSPERFTLDLLDVLIEDVRAQNGTEAGTGPRNSAAVEPRRFVSLNAPQRSLNPTLVDSGTTFFFASTLLWRSIHAQLKRHAPELRRTGPHHVCARMTDARRDSLPWLQLRLAGVHGRAASPLYVRPNQYMVKYPPPRRHGAHRRRAAEKYYCAEIFNNGKNGGTVIGASVLRNREVIFDMAQSTISFVDADCDWTTHRTAHMQNAFTFSPTCAAEEAQQNGTSTPAPLVVDHGSNSRRSAHGHAPWTSSLLASLKRGALALTTMG